ncbi:hypothetical protein B0H10DRAFT_1115402 [Mycena sp. CBHHK59/15]|nr:hypothetical protein B0H10DRAFT_1115402 [Mycena sp. CBHHK59/15]
MARIAILGPGGIGKTSLATAALHHPEVVTRYGRRIFVSCDSAADDNDLIALVASHIGLKHGKNLKKTIANHFSIGPPSLLVLDNLETPWENGESRAVVEEFLSLLTDNSQLSLMITMRGTERPAQVRWTRPFIPPLKPLTLLAARQTFQDIADGICDEAEIDELLLLTDNMPLAVSLIASVASYEGCSKVLSRWKNENTALLSEGYSQRSNLETSVMLSLSSPRMSAEAQYLLSLMSLLPDGLSDTDLAQSNLPMPNLMAHKSTLIRTSLAYVDHANRLRVLVPIREYVRRVHPPPSGLVRPLRQYLGGFTALYTKYDGLSLGDVVPRITSNLGNLHNLLSMGLQADDPDLADIIQSVIALNSFHRVTGRGHSTLMDVLPDLLPHVGDHQLHATFINELFVSWKVYRIQQPSVLISEALEHFRLASDRVEEARFYNSLGQYFEMHDNDLPRALHYFRKALSLARETGDANEQSRALLSISLFTVNTGAHLTARLHAREAQKQARLCSNFLREAAAIQTEARCWEAVGDFQRSLQLGARATELVTLCGHYEGDLELSFTSSEAVVHLLKTDYAESRKLYAYMANKSSREQSPYFLALSLLNISSIDIILDASEEDVHRNLDLARSMFVSIPIPYGIPLCDAVTADLYLRQGKHVAAKELFVRTLASVRGKDEECAIFCLERLGDLYNRMNDIRSTSEWATIYLAHGIKFRNTVSIHQALRCLGNIFAELGDESTALDIYDVSLSAFTRMDVHRSKGDCLLRMGDIYKSRGDVEKAMDLWETAREMFSKSSQTKDVVRIDERLHGIRS